MNVIKRLNVKPISTCGYWEMRHQLSDFVTANWDLLWTGAARSMGAAQLIQSDYWATERIQINDTRLCRRRGLKYAAGHKYNSDYRPTRAELTQTIRDLQDLIDWASEPRPAPFKLDIVHI